MVQFSPSLLIGKRLSGFGKVVAAQSIVQHTIKPANMLKYTFIALFFVTAVALGSCSESTTTAEEKTAINQMDSVSKAVKDSTDRLEAQTEKVEDALEKLDKEFPTDQPNK